MVGSRLRAWSKNAVALAMGIAISMAGAEVALRLYNPFAFSVWGDDIVLPIHRRYEIRNDKTDKLDPLIVHTRNSLGFRGPEKPEDFEAALTILAIGGSTTDCFYLSDGQDWPARLADGLSGSLSGLWLNNAGLSGHSTYGHQVLMQKVVRQLRPDVALFLVGANDIGLTEQRTFDRGVTREILTDASGASFLRSLILQSQVASLALNLDRYARAVQRDYTRAVSYTHPTPPTRRRVEILVVAVESPKKIN